jgi:hypothetical protein
MQPAADGDDAPRVGEHALDDGAELEELEAAGVAQRLDEPGVVHAGFQCLGSNSTNRSRRWTVDVREHVLEVGVGLEGVELGRFNEAEGHGLTPALGTCEETVLAPYAHRAHGAFAAVVVGQQHPLVEEHRQRRPVVQRVAEGLPGGDLGSTVGACCCSQRSMSSSSGRVRCWRVAAAC